MKNELLRHMLATIAYRFQKTVRNTTEEFGVFRNTRDTRTPIEIINHMYDVLNKTKIFIEKERYDKTSTAQLELRLEIERFHRVLNNLDVVLSEKELDIKFSKRLLQGPLSDVLCHIGQIAMLSGQSGNKIKGEDFFSAKIMTGNTSSEQALPKL